ncbi:10640_t:CDS:2, partial [Rhizophagus irregularis]
ESRYNLKNQGIDLFTEIQKKPLFNYIRYWRYLDLNFLEYLLNVLGTTPLSLISGSEDCFSKLEYFYCNNKTSSKILEGLAQTNKQIRKFEIIIMCDDRENSDNSTEVVKLIEAQGNLKEINFIRKNFYMNAKSYCKNLEESLIKHADTVQYLRIDWEPITKFLSYLVNLVSLDLTYICYERDHYDNLKTISLPLLKFLKAKHIPSNILSSLIESTKGYLVEISILYHYIFDKGRLIRAIYQNCLNLKILKLSMTNENISDFEYLLINCQYLNSLEVIGTNYFDWDELFEILTKSTPIGLFKFTFTSPISDLKRKMNSIKLFLDNWKDRHSMSLYIVSLEEAYMKMLKQQRRKFQQQDKQQQQILENLLQQYVAIGIVEKFSIQISYTKF